MKVDVVMCTWNSNKPHFVRCLNSIRREIPVHHFMLIDRFSNDGTVKTVKKVFSDAIVTETDERLGVARKHGIKLVDTELFMFVDDDIELCGGWFKHVMSHIDSETGGIQGQTVPMPKHLEKWVKWQRKYQRRFKEELSGGKVSVATSKNPDIIRGSTHNTLIKTSLVKDWNPPAIVSAFEDHLLLRHVVKKGYVWKVVWDLNVKHHGVSCLNDFLTRAKWNMAGARIIRYDDVSLWSLMKALPKGIIKASFASFQTKEPLILPYLTLFQFAYIQGWIDWNRYLEMRR